MKVVEKLIVLSLVMVAEKLINWVDIFLGDDSDGTLDDFCVLFASAHSYHSVRLCSPLSVSSGFRVFKLLGEGEISLLIKLCSTVYMYMTYIVLCDVAGDKSPSS